MTAGGEGEYNCQLQKTNDDDDDDEKQQEKKLEVSRASVSYHRR